MVSDEVVVSICCITYNHAPYIRQCLEGFMMQQTDFPIEVLIHDDASTDGTTEIIKEYEAKYPDIIKPIYEEENQWVKGRRGSVQFNFPRAKGKYIAMCEGDDYWVDPLKLQKQVDFLDNNTECVLCSHFFYQLQQGEQEYINILPSIEYRNFKFDINFYVSCNWVTQPVTIVFRKDALDLQLIQKYRNSKDNTLFYVLLKNGYGYVMDDIMAVYRLHDAGVWASATSTMRSIANITTIKSIYDIDQNEIAARYLYNSVYCQGYLGVSFFCSHFKLYFQVISVICKYFGLKRTIKLMKRSIMFSK